MSAARFPHFYPVMETMRSRPAMTSHDQLWPGKESPESLTNKLQIDQRTKVGPDTFHGGWVYWNIEDSKSRGHESSYHKLPMAWKKISINVWLWLIMYAFLHQISPDVCYFYSEFHGPWRLGDRWGPLGTVGEPWESADWPLSSSHGQSWSLGDCLALLRSRQANEQMMGDEIYDGKWWEHVSTLW
jgi:hypothetical protein